MLKLQEDRRMADRAAQWRSAGDHAASESRHYAAVGRGLWSCDARGSATSGYLYFWSVKAAESKFVNLDQVARR